MKCCFGFFGNAVEMLSHLLHSLHTSVTNLHSNIMCSKDSSLPLHNGQAVEEFVGRQLHLCKSTLVGIFLLMILQAWTLAFAMAPHSQSCLNSFLFWCCTSKLALIEEGKTFSNRVLTEAVQVSQQYSDDICLAYTLAAISNLLSEVGISKTSGIIGSSYSPVAGIGTSLSVQQQLYVLLRRSLKRAESLKLKRLVASIHLEIVKYDITVRIM